MYPTGVSGNVHHALLESACPLTHDVFEYRFTLDGPDAALTWRPGQFVSLNVGAQPDGTPILRSYSIANRAGDGGFTLIVKRMPGGAASEWLRALAPGARVRFTGPMGFFVLDLQHAGDTLFGATGTGVAPLVPMIEELLGRPTSVESGRVSLLWGLREERDRFWQDQLDALVARGAGRLSVTTVLSRPTDPASGPGARITPLVFAALPSLGRPTFYLCGNGAMIREVKAGLVQRGVDRKRQIRVEAFFD